MASDRYTATTKYRKSHLKQYSDYVNNYRNKLRQQAIEKLGGKCINPYNQHKEPYTDIRALQIDHINGGGLKEVKKIHRIAMYKKILDNSDGYQLLCANCNWIKKYENDETVRKYRD